MILVSIKMKFGQVLATFKWGRYQKLIIIAFWLITEEQEIRKGLDLGLSPANHAKYFLKIFSMTVSPIFITSQCRIQKIYSKMYVTLCANTHNDITAFEVNGIVWNTTKMNISRTERNFSMKQTLKLCRKDCIFRIYVLIVEVTLIWSLKPTFSKVIIFEHG